MIDLMAKLFFHEQGLSKQYRDVKVTAANLKLDQAKEIIELEPLAGSNIRDVALYASFTAFRTKKLVTLQFNGVPLSVAPGVRVAIDDETQIPASVDSMMRDLEQAGGTGELSVEQRKHVAYLAREVLSDFEAGMGYSTGEQEQ